MYLDDSTIEFYAGWNEAAIVIKRNGIEYAQVILDTVLPDRVYDAHINGQRQAAKVALVCNEVPLAAQLLFG